MNTRQRITTVLITIASLTIAGTLTATAAKKSAQAEQQAKALQAAQAKIKRGEYLVTIGGCNDCHTPFKLGPNGPEPWEAPVWRIESGIGFAVTRQIRLKAVYQHNEREGGFVRSNDLVAVQGAIWFCSLIGDGRAREPGSRSRRSS